MTDLNAIINRLKEKLHNDVGAQADLAALDKFCRDCELATVSDTPEGVVESAKLTLEQDAPQRKEERPESKPKKKRFLSGD